MVRKHHTDVTSSRGAFVSAASYAIAPDFIFSARSTRVTFPNKCQPRLHWKRAHQFQSRRLQGLNIPFPTTLGHADVYVNALSVAVRTHGKKVQLVVSKRPPILDVRWWQGPSLFQELQLHWNYFLLSPWLNPACAPTLGYWVQNVNQQLFAEARVLFVPRSYPVYWINWATRCFEPLNQLDILQSTNDEKQLSDGHASTDFAMAYKTKPARQSTTLWCPMWRDGVSVVGNTLRHNPPIKMYLFYLRYAALLLLLLLSLA